MSADAANVEQAASTIRTAAILLKAFQSASTEAGANDRKIIGEFLPPEELPVLLQVQLI